MIKSDHLGFKAAFEAALKQKLANMPQMCVCDDLIAEMKERRVDFEPRKECGITTEEAMRGYYMGVDAVYQVLFALLEVPPAEWSKVES